MRDRDSKVHMSSKLAKELWVRQFFVDVVLKEEVVLKKIGLCDGQVVMESMRMFPVAGAGIGRYADRDIDLGGYHIPKGTEVAVCLHTLHNVPWNFPEPDRFCPERFDGSVDATQSASSSGTLSAQLFVLLLQAETTIVLPVHYDLLHAVKRGNADISDRCNLLRRVPGPQNQQLFPSPRRGGYHFQPAPLFPSIQCRSPGLLGPKICNDGGTPQ